ncbi:oligosaccharide MFS transporter [Rahnella sp. SAP-1]|jgi:OHS family lactose permease-like MFS transporter|uniref:Oligosaccharide MFS transporter n=1 Tax=Rouxiella aceris TaxID=2703884 RepID=A0A848MJQ6_9GAMM|nr:oligosaccharide MFS transporter [Rouxiella aceris]NMP27310.1 oligosaccharide MFS transporter [Rouxiella aceris]
MSLPMLNRSAYIRISLSLFFFYFAWSISWSFLAIWLADNIGFTSTQIGYTLSINALFALAIKPVFGFIMDKLGLKKWLLIAVATASVLAAPFFIYVYQTLLQSHMLLGMLLGGAYLGTAYLAGILVFESYADRYSRAFGFEFGRVRMWGSLGWAIAAIFSGQLFNINPHINFTITSVAAVVVLLILLTLRTQGEGINWQAVNEARKDKVCAKDVRAFFQHASFWGLMLFYGGIIWMMQSAEQQFPRYFVSFFDTHQQGNSVLGYMGFVQSACEFVLMFFIPLLINRIGPKNGLLMAGFIIGTRLVLSALATQPWMIIVLKPLYGLEMTLLLVSIFKFLAENFDKRMTGTIYMVLGCFNYLGITAINPIAGYFYDKHGFATTYLFMGVIAWLITLTGLKLLGGKTKLRNIISDDNKLAHLLERK